jgi:hypothetical protein
MLGRQRCHPVALTCWQHASAPRAQGLLHGETLLLDGLSLAVTTSHALGGAKVNAKGRVIPPITDAASDCGVAATITRLQRPQQHVSVMRSLFQVKPL